MSDGFEWIETAREKPDDEEEILMCWHYDASGSVCYELGYRRDGIWWANYRGGPLPPPRYWAHLPGPPSEAR